MILDEFIEIGNLLEIYSPLLSEKQREYLEDHFENDLSILRDCKKIIMSVDRRYLIISKRSCSLIWIWKQIKISSNKTRYKRKN